MHDIADLRRQALTARRALGARNRRAASRHAVRRVSRLPRIQRADRIGLYWPLASEADPLGLARLLPAHVAFYFPRVTDHGLAFVQVSRPLSRDGWRRSALGVYEPPGPAGQLDRLDALIVPLAGFDAAANRIGLGGGFYDRTLAGLIGRSYRRPHLYGLAFEAQRVPDFTPQPWDIPLDAVISEHAVYRRALGAVAVLYESAPSAVLRQDEA